MHEKYLSLRTLLGLPSYRRGSDRVVLVLAVGTVLAAIAELVVGVQQVGAGIKLLLLRFISQKVQQFKERHFSLLSKETQLDAEAYQL